MHCRLATLTFLLITLLSACGAPTVDSSIDPESGRRFSDLLATDLITDHRAAIFSRMEDVFRTSTNTASFDDLVGQMIEVYGKPIRFEFKQEEFGTKTYVDGHTAPMMKIWYAAETSKHVMGSHFLLVEIVRDKQTLAVSSFGIVEFPEGVPPHLRS